MIHSSRAAPARLRATSTWHGSSRTPRYDSHARLDGRPTEQRWSLRRPQRNEHAFVMYADAPLLLFELADREDGRFQVAAARWHARFVLEADLPLRESDCVLSARACPS
jgi:hypothetical protein